MIDPKWLDALKLPLKAAVAAFLASGVLLAFNLNGVLDLGPLQPFARPVLIVVTAISGALTIVGIFDPLLAPLREKRRQSLLATRRAIRKAEEKGQRDAAEAAVLARLDHLSKEEIHYVAECLRKATPTFYTYVFHGPVTMLQGKGLAWTPGGQHHQDHYPFTFYDFVWKVLLERKDEFIKKDDDHKKADEAAKKAEARRRGY